MPETASRAAQLHNEKASTFHQTLKQEKGVPIPRHALLSANRHDGERMASPVPFALRFTPQRGTSPIAMVCVLGCDISGETDLALACLNPAVARKLWWILQIWCDFPTSCGACGALPIARANSRQIHELQVAGFAARASFPVRKKLRHGCNDLHARCTNLRWSPPGSSRGGNLAIDSAGSRT